LAISSPANSSIGVQAISQDKNELQDFSVSIPLPSNITARHSDSSNTETPRCAASVKTPALLLTHANIDGHGEKLDECHRAIVAT